MTRIRDLDFGHPLVAFAGTGRWTRAELMSHQPLDAQGVQSFVRWQDPLGTRFGFLSSTWAGGEEPTASAFVFAVDGEQDALPPRAHPSAEDRFALVGQVTVAAPQTARGLGDAPLPPEVLLWARAEQGGPLVPVDVHDSPHDGSQVIVMAFGPLPAGSLIARPRVAAEIATAAAPVLADLYRFTSHNRERVGRRAARGKGRPAARAHIGTLAQFPQADQHGY